MCEMCWQNTFVIFIIVSEIHTTRKNSCESIRKDKVIRNLEKIKNSQKRKYMKISSISLVIIKSKI